MSYKKCLYRSRRNLYQSDTVCLHPQNYEAPVDEKCTNVECPITKPQEDSK